MSSVTLSVKDADRECKQSIHVVGEEGHMMNAVHQLHTSSLYTIAPPQRGRAAAAFATSCR
jgi:hypothetical protein